MDRYFKALKNKTVLSTTLSKYTSIDYHKHYFNIGGYPVVSIDINLIVQDPSLSIVYKKYPFDAYVMRLDPFINYTWHVDEWRGVTINQLLKHTDSECFFGQVRSKWVMDIVKVPYEPDTLYLFDTQSKHSIINCENYRYVLTLDFHSKKDKLSYQDLYNYCKSVDLIS